MKGFLARRSSWPSSFATGLIGWNGFVLILALALGYDGAAWRVFGLASLVALAQVVVLRAAFAHVALSRGIAHGALWGGAVGGLLIGSALKVPPLAWLTEFWRGRELWLLGVGAYTGAPVGAFLSYFQRDDQRILASTRGEERFGRDAHWLEPFVFGAASYALSFAPTSPTVLWFVLPVGAMVGVFAAGASHFGSERVNVHGRWWVVAVVIGGVLGAASGLLFRQFSVSLMLLPWVHGTLAGMLTFLLTFARGRVLSRRYATAGGAS